MAYDFGFAKVYDKFTDASDAHARYIYIKKLLCRFGVQEGIVLDLACGTGGVSAGLLRDGYDVISVDNAPEMLCEARDRLAPFGGRALVLQQDMRELDLFGTVKATVCCMDSVNHLLSADDVFSVFSKVSLFTEPGGVFIFDVNSIYKHASVLANNTFVFEDEKDFLVWQNEYDERTNTVQMLIDVFSSEQNDTYIRFSDEIAERAYPTEELESMLLRAGFSQVFIYGDRTFSPPKAHEERIYFAAIK